LHLKGSGFLSGLLDLKKQSGAVLDAQKIRNTSQLIWSAVDLHDPPS
jgi:hypothetical protein